MSRLNKDELLFEDGVFEDISVDSLRKLDDYECLVMGGVKFEKCSDVGMKLFAVLYNKNGHKNTELTISFDAIPMIHPNMFQYSHLLNYTMDYVNGCILVHGIDYYCLGDINFVYNMKVNGTSFEMMFPLPISIILKHLSDKRLYDFSYWLKQLDYNPEYQSIQFVQIPYFIVNRNKGIKSIEKFIFELSNSTTENATDG